MKGSRPTRDQARGELTAAAQVHGRPLMQLNQLCRWYLYGFFLCLTGVGFVQGLGFLGEILGTLHYDTGVFLRGSFPLLFGSIYFFGGAIGLRFLPTSLGSSPHIHSLTMGLWSFWLGVIAAVGSIGVLAATSLLESPSSGVAGVVHQWGLALSGGCWFTGSLLLSVNLWKTIQSEY